MILCNDTIDHPRFSFNLLCCIIERLNKILSNPFTWDICGMLEFVLDLSVSPLMFSNKIFQCRHSDINVWASVSVFRDEKVSSASNITPFHLWTLPQYKNIFSPFFHAMLCLESYVLSIVHLAILYFSIWLLLRQYICLIFIAFSFGKSNKTFKNQCLWLLI